MGEPIDETFSPYWSCRWRTFWISASVSFITFLMPLADVDEPQAVVLQSQGGEGRELLMGRLLMGGFVGEPGKNHSRQVRHGREQWVGIGGIVGSRQ